MHNKVINHSINLLVCVLYPIIIFYSILLSVSLSFDEKFIKKSEYAYNGSFYDWSELINGDPFLDIFFIKSSSELAMFNFLENIKIPYKFYHSQFINYDVMDFIPLYSPSSSGSWLVFSIYIYIYIFIYIYYTFSETSKEEKIPYTEMALRKKKKEYKFLLKIISNKNQSLFNKDLNKRLYYNIKDIPINVRTYDNRYVNIIYIKNNFTDKGSFYLFRWHLNRIKIVNRFLYLRNEIEYLEDSVRLYKLLNELFGNIIRYSSFTKYFSKPLLEFLYCIVYSAISTFALLLSIQLYSLVYYFIATLFFYNILLMVYIVTFIVSLIFLNCLASFIFEQLFR